MKPNPSIDIVIPLYNEASIIAASVDTLIHFLHESHFPYEYKVILANNASTDKSFEICRNLAKKYPNVEAFDVGKKGKGFAIRSAWEKSGADILAFMDADLSSDLAYFKPLVDAVISGNDLAIGNRLGKNSKVMSRHLMRGIASRTYNIIIRSLFHTGVADHQCGFKAIKKESFLIIKNDLHDNAFFIDTELIVHAHRRNMKISQIDIVWRDAENSTVSIGGTSLELFKSAINLKKKLKKSQEN